ncbi:MAG: acyl-CoA dehydrogenase family protein, partial [Variovorax sp.]|nr:acyl-CoA dehydrogenase family protein [Variovorax sp.]
MSALPLRRAPAVPETDTPTSVDPAVLARLSDQFASTAADHDRSGAFPRQNFESLLAHGLVGLVAPAAYGGGGATLVTARRVIAAVARGEPATALILTMTYLQHQALARRESRWPAHLRERVARDAVAHGALINALRVEPALGSPA